MTIEVVQAEAPRTTNVVRGIPLGVRIELIKDLNLQNIRRKLMESYPEGKGWTEAQAFEAEKWYKRFLEVILRDGNQSEQRVPNHVVDTFWHCHILDTRAYAEDCAMVFGEFLHHYQYFGMNGDADQRNAKSDDTNTRYRELFGEDPSASGHFFGMKDDRLLSNEEELALPQGRPYMFDAAMSNGNGDGCSSCR